MFGSAPRLQDRLSDLARVFDAPEKRQLLAKLDKIVERFPQLQVDLLSTTLEPGVDLRLYCFWVFNAAGLSSDFERNGNNRSVLFTIDAANQRANLIVGYGLEPFVGEKHLEQILAAGAGAFKKDDYFGGATACLEMLQTVFAQICKNMSQTYGIDPEDLAPKEETTNSGY